MARDAFKEGRTVFTKSADEVSIYMEQIANNPGAINAFRAGTMDAIRTRMGTGRAKSMMGLLSNPEAKEGAILRTIYPYDELDGILTRISTAAQSQAARNYVVGQSPTAQTLLQAARTGSGVNAEELTSVAQGNPFATLRVASKLIAETNKNMSERDRNRVAQILVSEDPGVVRNALVDESGMARFQLALNRAMRIPGKALPSGAAYLGGTFPRRPENQ